MENIKVGMKVRVISTGGYCYSLEESREDEEDEYYFLNVLEATQLHDDYISEDDEGIVKAICDDPVNGGQVCLVYVEDYDKEYFIDPRGLKHLGYDPDYKPEFKPTRFVGEQQVHLAAAMLLRII